MQHVPDVTSQCLPQWYPDRITWPRGACALRTGRGAIIGCRTTCTRWRPWAVTWAWAEAWSPRVSTPQCTAPPSPSSPHKIYSMDPGECIFTVFIIFLEEWEEKSLHRPIFNKAPCRNSTHFWLVRKKWILKLLQFFEGMRKKSLIFSKACCSLIWEVILISWKLLIIGSNPFERCGFLCLLSVHLCVCLIFAW